MQTDGRTKEWTGIKQLIVTSRNCSANALKSSILFSCLFVADLKHNIGTHGNHTSDWIYNVFRPGAYV